MGSIGSEISEAAFRRLVRTGGAVEVAVEDMSRRGRVRLDGHGRVVGAAGPSIGPDRHRIEIDGRTFWTWCAHEVLGIFGALPSSAPATYWPA